MPKIALYKGQVPAPPWIGHKSHVGLQIVYEWPHFCIFLDTLCTDRIWLKCPFQTIPGYIEKRKGYAESINPIQPNNKERRYLDFIDIGPWFALLALETSTRGQLAGFNLSQPTNTVSTKRKPIFKKSTIIHLLFQNKPTIKSKHTASSNLLPQN